MTTPTTMLDHALAYATEHGIAVFPVWPVIAFRDGYICACNQGIRCPNPGKHPMGNLAPKGLKDATRDPAIIKNWWLSRRDANIGLRTGGRVIVLDVDPRHGGGESLLALENRHGSLPASWRVETGGNGQHIYFKETSETARINNSVSKLGPGLDIRTRGGYVIAPPSLHVSGNRYQWIARDELEAMPDWVFTVLHRASFKPNGSGWRNRILADVIDGQRNDTVARYAGHLLRQRVEPTLVLDLMQCWNQRHCKPPLSEREIEATVNSICGLEIQRRNAL